MLKKVLFIAKNYKNGIVNGGNEVSKRNFQMLSELYNVDEILIEFKVSPLIKILDTLKCNSLNFNKQMKARIKELLKENKYEFIWIDNSLYGTIGKYIKTIDKSIKVVTFFHNLEYFYFLEKIKVEGIKNLVMLPYAYLNERRAIITSDKLITLNNRDSDKLYILYKKKADLVIPLTLKDKYEIKEIKEIKNDKPRALFVGSNFFANVHGIEWFIKEVLPEVDINLVIVGSGMEEKKQYFESLNSKVKVKGFVENIGDEYTKADFVVAPIFHGSGMKTKTTEALMYGKTIYGTAEAFEGFEVDLNQIGKICNNNESFIEAIKNHKALKNNSYSRKIYLEKYSDVAIKKRITEI